MKLISNTLKLVTLCAFVSVIWPAHSNAQILGTTGTYTEVGSFNTYGDLMYMQRAAPGAFKFGLYGFDNPAMLEYLNAPFDLQVTYNSDDFTFSDDPSSQIGVFGALGPIGIGYFNRPIASPDTTLNRSSVGEYRISIGGGNKTFSQGINFGFFGEGKSADRLENHIGYGALYRPNGHISVSGAVNSTYSANFVDGYVDVGVRPLADWPLTLYGDLNITYQDPDSGVASGISMFNEDLRILYGAGVNLELVDGIRLNGRFRTAVLPADFADINPDFDPMEITFGIDYSAGTSGIGVDYFSNSERVSYTYRTGAQDRTFLDDAGIFSTYVKLDLSGSVTYQTFRYFDSRSRLFDILETIDRAARNDNVQGLFINAVNMGGSYAMKWEIREKLRQFREEYGKRVVIFIERESIADYHFASVADKVVIDELGSVSINGFAAGRSFYKNLLEKNDIGFNELRYFKYKSAVEGYTRTGFSEGDEEQRKAYINDWYDIAKEEITRSRGITPEKYDEIVDAAIQYDAEELKELGLVDEIGRWNQLDDMEDDLAPDMDFTVSPCFLVKENQPIDDQWSLSRDAIALIYVDGVCAMEGGIDARNLWRSVDAAMENDNIGAIVLRVDSPGGDPLASEYIAKIVRDNKGKKPILVSQGMLAASGGYWLSMDADEIYTTPVTITGSIGVISAWVYDKGLADTLGITTDIVKRGKYSDLNFAWQDPIIGLGLPYRNLTEEEEALRKEEILELYDDFVERVAKGRDMDVEEIKEVAQGRVWTGRSAIGIGLADKIGGLSDVLERARVLARIEKKENMVVYEYPPREDVNFQGFISQALPFGMIQTASKSLDKLQYMLEMNGKAMPMLPLDWQYDQNFANPGAEKQ
ncbi:MAG: hypothetical protein Kapaf2KO_10640 [Candidatus Kapaibacteriales bacterium]